MLLPLLMPLVTLITDTLLSHFEINPFLLGISTFAFDADKGLVALTFIFACLAGIFTSIQNKHLTISVVKDNLPEKAQLITDSIIRVISIALLLSLFFATFPNIISIISPDESIWGIPVRILFLAISIMSTRYCFGAHIQFRLHTDNFLSSFQLGRRCFFIPI